jgi:DHA2 family multidrug resistance protein-like MFS transporter
VNASANSKAITAILLGVVIVTMDISLTSTALPSIAAALEVSAASAISIVNIYYVAVVASLLPLAALGEIHGHRRIFLIGLAVFALGSLICGLSGSLPMLKAGRAVLGIGTAAVSATTPALIRSVYPPQRLGRGLGLYAMIVGIAFSIGPTLASSVLTFTGWNWLFLPNVPLALLAFTLATKGLNHGTRSNRSFDTASALLCGVFFAALLSCISAFAHQAWSSVALTLTICSLSGIGLIRRELHKPAPIFAFDLFRIPVFSLSSATAICSFAVQGLAFVALPFLLQTRLGYDQSNAGFVITPWPVTLAIMAVVAPRLELRIPAAILGCIGLVTLAVGLASITTLSSDSSILDIGLRLIVCGIGFGLFQAPNMTVLMSSAPSERSGGASGILATSRLLGQAIGAAIVAFSIAAWPDDGILIAVWIGVMTAMGGSALSLLRIAPFIRRAGTPRN